MFSVFERPIISVMQCGNCLVLALAVVSSHSEFYLATS